VSNGYKTYKYENDEFTYVSQYNFCLFFQWCDKTISWLPKKAISTVSDKLEIEKVCDLDPETDWFCTCAGGVAIFAAKDCKVITIYNLLTKEVKYSEDVLSFS
jgi:hypothetical protein